MASDSEDDYLTMAIPELSTNKARETLTERKKRLARESEARANHKSKAELAALAAQKREDGLAKNLLNVNGQQSKGAKMMAALGYKPGEALGVGANGLIEPVGLEMKEGRGGIGADSERKRKFREEVEAREEGEKRRKVDEGEYRERVAAERNEKRIEGMVWGAMKVADGLQDEGYALEDAESKKYGVDGIKSALKERKHLKDVNVLWRRLVKQRLVDEEDKRMRFDLHQSLSRLPTYDDPDEDKDDKMAMGKKGQTEEVELELDEEDEELDAFEALSEAEKLEKIVRFLRERWKYCFWCKYKYPDEAMEGCPGTTEEDHD